MREWQRPRTAESRANMHEHSFSESSPWEETEQSIVWPGRSNSCRLIRAAILLRALHDFWLLVALIDLDGYAGGWRRRSGLHRFRHRVTNGDRSGCRSGASPEQT